MQACIHTHTDAYIYTYIHVNIHTYIHTFIHTYIRTYVRTYTHAYIRIHVCILPSFHIGYLGFHIARVIIFSHLGFVCF